MGRVHTCTASKTMLTVKRGIFSNTSPHLAVLLAPLVRRPGRQLVPHVLHVGQRAHTLRLTVLQEQGSRLLSLRGEHK